VAERDGKDFSMRAKGKRPPADKAEGGTGFTVGAGCRFFFSGARAFGFRLT
jgi:hypothetical protein